MIHFGTGGWRAVIGDGFTKANVQLLTLALARKMLDEGRADKGFVIGYDRRFLSEEAAGMGGLLVVSAGIDRMQLRFSKIYPIMWLSMRIALWGKLILISYARCHF